MAGFSAKPMRFITWAYQGAEHFADELTQDEFHQAIRAADIIAEYTEAEETFRAVLENYGELEVALLTIAQENTILGHIGHGRAMRHRLLLDRRFANLLSSCRLYVDYALSTEIHSRNPDGRERVKTATNREYDTRLGYRVMEALRNYVQHRGFPLQGLTYQESAVGPIEDGISETYIKPQLALDKLRQGAGFKRAVFEEMEGLKPPGDVRQWTREYVDGLRHVHQVLIQQVGAEIDSAIATYLKVCRRFAGRIASEDVIVRYEQRDENNKSLDRHSFTTEIVEHTISMKLENRYRTDVSRQFVTNAVDDGE
jgi:hypothetical protein